MAVKVGINGFGRIGRLVFRAAQADGDVDVVAVNDLTDSRTLGHLLKYDSTHGKYPGEVTWKEKSLVVDANKVSVLGERDPSFLPWGAMGVDIVIESTGFFTDKTNASKHIEAGADRVIISAPAKGDVPTVVLGINDDIISGEDTVISNASCTTNCLAPMAKVLNDTFGLQKGLMTTIHAYTGDQSVLDAPHKDLRRARSAAVSMIPTTTGAASAVGKVIPELNGKLDGMAVRVPTPDGSFTDLVATLERPATKEGINEAFKAAADGSFRGILEYSDEPLVSADIVGNPNSCIFDSDITTVIGDNLVKVCGWYDNEWGYSNRCVDLIKKLAK
ncbi:MAG TPA: type I glyceraldehyde-3-phosphate dehydrogenase [Candidatus Latescibacteria bacterium]|nr:type I glyceraldehyde-3-phosphate dehydrogenase [Gemmatimonadota bacterium]HCR18950.1 type I glyceraldehyde-3-phosphate dehydrogenase [Candidatus Latescibacterota bacterium]